MCVLIHWEEIILPQSHGRVFTKEKERLLKSLCLVGDQIGFPHGKALVLIKKFHG